MGDNRTEGGPYRQLPDEDPVDLACQKALIEIERHLKDTTYATAKELTLDALHALRHITEAISGLNDKIKKVGSR